MSNCWAKTLIIDELMNQNLNLQSDLQIIIKLVIGPENCFKWFEMRISVNLLSFISIS